MIKLEIIRHKYAYAVLLAEVAVFTVLFLAAWPNLILQRFLIVFMVGFYVLWGSVTHLKADHFNDRIFLEYLGVAGLAGTLLFLITL
jgi:hypothetical protein